MYLYSRTVGVPSLVIVSTEPSTRTRTLEGIRATRTKRTKKKMLYIDVTISIRKDLVRLHLIFIHLRLIKTQRFVWTD